MRTQLLDSSDCTFTDSFVFLSEEMAGELLKISGPEKGARLTAVNTALSKEESIRSRAI